MDDIKDVIYSGVNSNIKGNVVKNTPHYYKFFKDTETTPGNIWLFLWSTGKRNIINRDLERNEFGRY